MQGCQLLLNERDGERDGPLGLFRERADAWTSGAFRIEAFLLTIFLRTPPTTRTLVRVPRLPQNAACESRTEKEG